MADDAREVATILHFVAPCPVCGKHPDIDECDPLMKAEPPLGWYANCFSYEPYEHSVGVSADTRRQAVKEWNKIARTGDTP